VRGYGRVYIKEGSAVPAHRISYELAFGPVPEGLSLDHLCRVTNCVRPDHLEAVPIGVNILRGSSPSALAARMTECSKGHPFDVANTIRRKNGHRRCRTCENAYWMRRKDSRNAASV
jgi:hypothetical protein